MLLPFEVQDSLIEYDPFPLFVEHTNQALCEILPLTGSVRPLSGNGRSLRGLRPKAHRHLQACKDDAVWGRFDSGLEQAPAELYTRGSNEFPSPRQQPWVGSHLLHNSERKKRGLSPLRIIYHSSVNFLSG